jgi:hypothetical protein
VSMVDNDGVYVSQRRRVQRRKKALVAVVGLAAVLGGGAYGVSAWHTARDTTITGDTGALAPVAPAPSSPSPADEVPWESVAPSGSPSGSQSGSPSPSPGARTSVARLSGVRQSSRPSPTPSASASASASAVNDDEVASAQVSRLLRTPRVAPSGGLTAAGEAITVANETSPDGSSIRVVSARYDLTARGASLGAADSGQPFGTVRCTQNLLVGQVAQVRPQMLLCWRTSAAKSVVAVATSATGRPAAAVSAAAIDRAWRRLG